MHETLPGDAQHNREHEQHNYQVLGEFLARSACRMHELRVLMRSLYSNNMHSQRLLSGFLDAIVRHAEIRRLKIDIRSQLNLYYSQDLSVMIWNAFLLSLYKNLRDLEHLDLQAAQLDKSDLLYPLQKIVEKHRNRKHGYLLLHQLLCVKKRFPLRKEVLWDTFELCFLKNSG